MNFFVAAVAAAFFLLSVGMIVADAGRSQDMAKDAMEAAMDAQRYGAETTKTVAELLRSLDGPGRDRYLAEMNKGVGSVAYPAGVVPRWRTSPIAAGEKLADLGQVKYGMAAAAPAAVRQGAWLTDAHGLAYRLGSAGKRIYLGFHSDSEPSRKLKELVKRASAALDTPPSPQRAELLGVLQEEIAALDLGAEATVDAFRDCDCKENK